MKYDGIAVRTLAETEEIMASMQPGPSTPVIQTTTWAMPKRIQKRIARNLQKRRRMSTLRAWIGAQFVTAGVISVIVHFTQYMAGGGNLHILLTSFAVMEIVFGVCWPRIDKKPAVG